MKHFIIIIHGLLLILSFNFSVDEWKERKKKASLRALYAEIERDKKKLKPRPFNPITQDDCDDTE